MKKSDAELHAQVLQELQCDARVNQTEVGVQVHNGVVTLTGSVDSWGKRVAAQNAAHRVAGVLDVANDVRVHIEGQSPINDAELAAAVRHTLEWDVLVPEALILSTVTDGWVLLEGKVAYLAQRDDAERAVHKLKGVRGVTNRIEVVPGPVMPYAVRAQIEQALNRHAERETKRIQLEMNDGRVTVRGVVHSYPERAAVIGAVRGVPGVTHVEDQLRIEPYLAE